MKSDATPQINTPSVVLVYFSASTNGFTMPRIAQFSYHKPDAQRSQCPAKFLTLDSHYANICEIMSPARNAPMQSLGLIVFELWYRLGVEPKKLIGGFSTPLRLM